MVINIDFTTQYETLKRFQMGEHAIPLEPSISDVIRYNSYH